MESDELIPHLFRTEYRKIISVLSKVFGFEHIEIAEDIASDTFLSATETWGMKGLPENPVGWLYSVAKNKAKNYIHHKNIFTQKIAGEIKHSSSEAVEHEIDLSEKNITDSQLQMLFAICHPAIAVEAQVGLALRILCGFGIDEIANAFLTNKETINKRLFRAKEKLREEKIDIELPPASQMDLRLEAVLGTIYLLFNEGYYSLSQNKTIRKELCFEAMRLCKMLVENENTNKPSANALLSLMCFHSSRFEARFNKKGETVLYDEQDTGLWNPELISQGGYYLKRSANGDLVSKYHLEAGIAYWSTQKPDTKEKWENVLQLYNRLLQIQYSPIAALNRTYALSKANSREEAIAEAEKLNLVENPFYFGLLGELWLDIDKKKSIENYKKALSLAKTETGRQAIQAKLDKITEKKFAP